MDEVGREGSGRREQVPLLLFYSFLFYFPLVQKFPNCGPREIVKWSAGSVRWSQKKEKYLVFNLLFREKILLLLLFRP